MTFARVVSLDRHRLLTQSLHHLDLRSRFFNTAGYSKFGSLLYPNTPVWFR